MRKALFGLCVVLAITASACGGDGDDNTTAEPTDVATTSPTPVATPCSLEDGDRAQVQVGDDNDPVEVAHLSDLRPNADGCPRVVFEFNDDVPNYRVGYIEPPITDCGEGSAAPIQEWASDAYLNVRFFPARTAGEDEQATPTYDGPSDLELNGDVLRHIKKMCDFEADLTWIIALDAEHDFKVDTFEDPARLVIDISGS